LHAKALAGTVGGSSDSSPLSSWDSYQTEKAAVAIALGVAWSTAAVSLPDLGHLVDFVEAPGWAIGELAGRPLRRKILHNLDKDFSLSRADAVDDAWRARVNQALTAIDSPWFSMHLGFSAPDVRFEDHMLPAGPILDREELFSTIVANVNRAKSYITRPLLLENLDYCPEGAYEHVCDPAFISAVIAETRTELLLDLAHLQVTASWFDADPFAMLEELPLNRTLELHISSPRPLAGDSARLDDVHAPLTETDIALLRHVLSRSRPAALVLEYRDDPQLLREQLLLLARTVGRVWRGIGC
jgi:uncharacterized protein (UPF0276 family)